MFEGECGRSCLDPIQGGCEMFGALDPGRGEWKDVIPQEEGTSFKIPENIQGQFEETRKVIPSCTGVSCRDSRLSGVQRRQVSVQCGSGGHSHLLQFLSSSNFEYMGMSEANKGERNRKQMLCL